MATWQICSHFALSRAVALVPSYWDWPDMLSGLTSMYLYIIHTDHRESGCLALMDHKNMALGILKLAIWMRCTDQFCWAVMSMLSMLDIQWLKILVLGSLSHHLNEDSTYGTDPNFLIWQRYVAHVSQPYRTDSTTAWSTFLLVLILRPLSFHRRCDDIPNAELIWAIQWVISSIVTFYDSMVSK